MALSGSTDLNYTVGNLITDALRLMGVGLNGETPTAQETNDTLMALELHIKNLSKKGMKLWQRRTKEITLTAGDNSYTLGATGTVTMDRPEDIIAAYRRDSNNKDTPVGKMSREEYWRLSNKTAVGVPINYYYDPQLDNGVLYIYLTPDATVAANNTLIIDYKKPIDDADATTNDIEIPKEWYLPLKWIVADEIMIEFDIPEEDKIRIERKANSHKKHTIATDIESGTSIFFRPTMRGKR